MADNRNVSSAAAVAGMVGVITRSDKEEETFVIDSMKANVGYARVLAGMTRGKTVKEAVRKLQMNGVKCPMGKPLPADAKLFKHLPKTFRCNTYFALLKLNRMG